MSVYFNKKTWAFIKVQVKYTIHYEITPKEWWRTPPQWASSVSQRAGLQLFWRLNQQIAQLHVLLQNINHRCLSCLYKHKRISKKEIEKWKTWNVSTVFKSINCWKKLFPSASFCSLTQYPVYFISSLWTIYDKMKGSLRKSRPSPWEKNL